MRLFSVRAARLISVPDCTVASQRSRITQDRGEGRMPSSHRLQTRQQTTASLCLALSGTRLALVAGTHFRAVLNSTEKRMNRRQPLKLITASIALGLGLSGAALAQSGGTIKVGILHSLSGTMAISETVLKDTVLMAIDEINAKGGVLGKKLVPVVVDPASNWPLFAEKTKQLLGQDKVAVIFGCWTSVSRKSVLPVVEEMNGLLFYPVQYEGEELSKNVFYTGAAPNQQAIPAVDYLMSKDGGGAKRWVLLGTDYVYPRTTNKILRAYLKSKGVKESDIDEKYTPFGHSDYQTIVADIKKFSAGGKTAVVSTINGDSNVPFYKELGNAGLKAKDVPVVAFSVGEEELRGVDTKPLVGHLAAWNYFMSIKSPANTEFIKKWSAYAKAKKLPGADKPLTNDPMEATYIGINMWKQAVEKAKSTDTDKVIAAMAGQTFAAPSGITSKMDEKNHHLHKSVFIGEIKADGQFNVVWKTPGPVKAKPWSPYIEGNDKKPDEPTKMAAASK
jgi:urea transport system substrate-binding protein